METVKQYNAARRVSVPLVIWKTPDAAATISAVKAEAGNDPVFSWDIVRGLKACNELAVLSVLELLVRPQHKTVVGRSLMLVTEEIHDDLAV